MQTAVYYGICSTRFTSSGSLLSAHATPRCERLRGQCSPRPDVPREAGGPGPREGSLGETRAQHRLPQRRAAGRREMARGCGQPPRSPDSPGKGGFFPKSPQPGGPVPHLERAGLLAGAMRGTAPGAGARGRFPQPLAWCGGAALATFPWAVATPSILGRKGAALQAVYQPEREYPQVAMATWASPWEPEGRQSANTQQDTYARRPLRPRHGVHAWDPASWPAEGTLRPTPAHACPRACIARAPQGRGSSPGGSERASPSGHGSLHCAQGSGPFPRPGTEGTCPRGSALGSPLALSHSHKPTDPVPGMGQGDKRQGAIPAGHLQPEPRGPASPAEGLGQEDAPEAAARVRAPAG